MKKFITEFIAAAISNGISYFIIYGCLFWWKLPHWAALLLLIGAAIGSLLACLVHLGRGFSFGAMCCDLLYFGGLVYCARQWQSLSPEPCWPWFLGLAIFGVFLLLVLPMGFVLLDQKHQIKDLQDLKVKNEQLTAAAQQLQEQLGSLQEQLGSLQEQLGSLQEQLGSLQEQNAEQETTIAQLQPLADQARRHDEIARQLRNSL